MRFIGHVVYGIARLLWLFVVSAIIGAVIGAIVGIFNGQLAASIGKGTVISLEISAVFFVWGVFIAIRNAGRGDYRRSRVQQANQEWLRQQEANAKWACDKAAYDAWYAQQYAAGQQQANDADTARRYAEWHVTQRGYSDGL